MNIEINGVPELAGASAQIAADLPPIEWIAVAVSGAGLILFTLFVLPIWLLLHYRSRSKHLPLPPPAMAPRAASPDELAELARYAERIENRLDAIERLMDAETPMRKS